MKYYELTYLISPDLDEKEAKDLSEKINGFIPELTGIIKNNSEPEKKSLGYSINEKSEAFLVSLNFSLETDKVIELEKKIKLEKEILRHIITRKEERKKSEKIEKKEIREKKVDLEGIDEKIDEILS